MKSYVDQALTIYDGIITDATARWPNLKGSFEKDHSYLRRAVEARKMPFLAIVLPSMCKALDKSLAQGRLVVSEFPKGYPLSKGRPELFRDLFSLIFDDFNMLKSDAEIDAVSFLRQLLLCCKKVRVPFTSETLKETLDEYFEIENQLPSSWPGTWDTTVPGWQPRYGHPLWGIQSEDATQLLVVESGHRNTLPWNTLRNLCRRVVSGLGEPMWWDLRPKHGPGVVSDANKGLKYEFPYWPQKLDLWFPYDWFGAGLLQPDFIPSGHEPPSRLIAVPKSQKGPRLICAEPTAHQWMQQSIWRWLEGQVERSPLLSESLTFRSQDNSRKRALDASLSGQLATVDLSSASDRVSTRLVEFVFQGSSILDGLHACRTRLLKQKLSKEHDSHLVLRKFSTQGSTVTFPIQSIIFTILAVWALRLTDGKEQDLTLDSLREAFREVTVFGDDIIIPVRALECLRLVLHECGLKVNDSKTFGEGNFRESCGMDAFRGFDVSPAYYLEPYDGTAASIVTTVETANNFFMKGYWHASEAVVSAIPPQERKLLRVCGSEDGNFGLRSFVGTDVSHLRQGWDSALQRTFSISLAVRSIADMVRGRDSASLSQYFFERPNPLEKWAAGQVSRVRVRKARTRVLD
jgi:hypothetical protein